MAVYKNIASQKIAVYAHDTAADAPKTGDAAQITAQISLDGAATAATNDANPTELDAADAPGIYLFDATQAETNADLIILCGASSTGDVSIEPVIIYTLPGTNAGVSTDVVQISGDSTAANNAESFFDGTGYAGTNNVIPTVTAVTNQVTADVTAISGDSGAADNLELDYDGTGYAKANSTIGTTTTNTDLVTAADVRTEMDANSTQLAAIVADTNELQTDDVPGLIAALNDPTAATIADAVLDEALAGHVGAGSLGKAVADIETDATAILADTNELQTNQGAWATATVVDLNADQSGVTVGTVTTLTGHTAQTGDSFARLGAPAGASMSADIAALPDSAAVNTAVDDAFTTIMADSVPADGVIPTREQALYMINQFLLERETSGVTVTVNKVDGTTALFTLTLDDDTSPTSITRAT
jgi:hypothetical protein